MTTSVQTRVDGLAEKRTHTAASLVVDDGEVALRKTWHGRIVVSVAARRAAFVIFTDARHRSQTGARILAEIGDATAFPSAAHLAAYAGLAPVTRRSGSSIKGETPAMRGNRAL
jgi:transposase